MREVYIEGDFGDLGNVDWFDVANNQKLEVEGIRMIKVDALYKVTAEVMFHGSSGLTEVKIVRNPKLHKQGTVAPTKPKFTGFDIGLPVWVDGEPGERRKPGILVSVQGKIGNGIIVEVDGETDRQEFAPSRVHRLSIGTPKKMSKPYHVYDRKQFRPENERMNDFFKGKDTW